MARIHNLMNLLQRFFNCRHTNLRENMSDKNPIMGYGRTLLHCAAMSGKLEICKYLIEDTSQINLHPRDNAGCTPLGYAAQYGHLDVCKLINVSDKNPMFHERWSPLGWGSPLDRAVYYGQLEVFKYLAADMRGPHMTHLNPSKEDGWSLLHYAAKGQLISKCPYEMIVSSKIPTKFFVPSWGLLGSFLGLPMRFLVYDITY